MSEFHHNDAAHFPPEGTVNPRAVDATAASSGKAPVKSRGSHHKHGKGTTAASKHHAGTVTTSKTDPPVASAERDDAARNKIPTSVQVYHRMRTDPAHFQAAHCSLGYVDIRRGVLEMPLSKFVPISEGGDVPWHRVVLFKYDGEVVWDRANKICRLDEVAQQEASNAASVVPLARTFRVLSWNIMDESARPRQSRSTRSDVAEQHRQDNALRAMQLTHPADEDAADGHATMATWPSPPDVGVPSSSSRVVVSAADLIEAETHRVSRIIDFLLTVDAEIVCLQEVGPTFLNELNPSDAAVKAWPYRAQTTLECQNILFLSRFTITSQFSFALPHEEQVKQQLAIELHDPFIGAPIVLIGVHLTSSRATQAATKRREQLALTARYLQGSMGQLPPSPWEIGTRT
jgi:hypothetical protein